MQDDLRRLRVVNCINQESLPGLRQFLARHDFHVIELDGVGVVDGATFLARAAEVLPLDPPLASRDNWDAFSDSVWGGLEQLAKERVALIWTSVEEMLKRGLQDLLISVTCLQQVAAEVATARYGISHPVVFVVFLAGKGDNFKPFQP